MMSSLKKYIFSQEILLVFKHSRFNAAKDLKAQDDIIFKSLQRSHEENLCTIEAIETELKTLKIPYQVISRSKLTREHTKNKLIIAVGGDGTVLDVSHYCEDAVLLGINSDPRQSVGALCVANKESFPYMIKEIINNEAPLTSLSRMNISIDEKELDILALNDVLFCHKNPSFMSRYVIYTNDLMSEQKSSGLWISTPLGSTGAIFSAGGALQDLNDKKLQFLVREPYLVTKDKLLYGFVLEKQKLKIKNALLESMIFIDGPHQKHSIPLGATISLSLSKKPLNIVYGHILNAKRQELIKDRLSYRK